MCLPAAIITTFNPSWLRDPPCLGSMLPLQHRDMPGRPWPRVPSVPITGAADLPLELCALRFVGHEAGPFPSKPEDL